MRMRTISETYFYIKGQDPETSLTPYSLRQLIISGVIPSVKSGRKYLIDLDKLDYYLSSPGLSTIQEKQIGVIRQVQEKLVRS